MYISEFNFFENLTKSILNTNICKKRNPGVESNIFLARAWVILKIGVVYYVNHHTRKPIYEREV